jgi:alpha-1,3-mannosylglycoprotein beta-1,4-N-acetylglucosaminyltransferase A/B
VTGNAEHPSDRFFNTTVEVLPASASAAAAQRPGGGFLQVGAFDQFGLAEGLVPVKLGPLQVQYTQQQFERYSWSILIVHHHHRRPSSTEVPVESPLLERQLGDSQRNFPQEV